MADPFWLVWNPAGHRPPTFRHPTPESAIVEAGRLAEANPGATFFILAATGFAIAEKPKAQHFPLYKPAPVSAPEPRVLKHGEYLPGDRVRYTGRVMGWHSGVGSTGVVETVETAKTVRVKWEHLTYGLMGSGVYPENLEHESLPQFEVGDRVAARNYQNGGDDCEGTVTRFENGEVYAEDWTIGSRGGSLSLSDNQIDLVLPVQAGGAA